MTTTEAAAGQERPLRRSRPGRGIVVARNLADLHGPVSGVVELPLYLFWSSPDRTFDLADPVMRGLMYEKVLCEARSFDDLATYLDGLTLAAIWPQLLLPRDVRHVWELRHPALGRAAA